MFSSLIVLFGSLQTISASKFIELQSSIFFLLLEFSGLYCQKCLEKKTECTDGETGKTYAVEDVWKVSGKCLQKVCKKEEDGVSIRTEGLV